MKIKTSELTDVTLDWAVAKCGDESLTQAPIWVEITRHFGLLQKKKGGHYSPSTDDAQGGPIIDRERISTEWSPLWGCWAARDLRNAAFSFTGPTRLIAAMRCYVASKLGDVVDVPDALCAMVNPSNPTQAPLHSSKISMRP